MKSITTLKKKIKSKEVTIGSWITIGHSSIAEILSLGGFDWLTIDMEHSAITLAEAQNLIQTIELSRCVPLVRVGSNDPNLIKRVMDAGSHGVIVPQVNSVQEAKNAVNAVKYPPNGNRGVGLARAQGYGLDFEKYKKWNDENSIVIIQIENILGVENLEEIIAVKGVDGFIVGPYDLSASLGVPGEFEHPRYLQAMEKIKTVIEKKDTIAAGFHVVPLEPEMVFDKIKEGYCFLAYSLDSLFIADYARRDLLKIKGDLFSEIDFIKEI
ncbi:HpcH/HpaI aldolase family protein [Methanoplanus limicola]|uniref:HpcH/HpaI aldolase n=1 Tax=Methanoplanus limicola DSM 2279 TaxID=937775 RepID=H1YXD0_9EURY|nr:aldolase/citrate lyase family protein [Methanoplanus limicola]EHQ36867.1 HpcH/HpaI aldolase [Methanoplanus limicola DSM 2279]